MQFTPTCDLSPKNSKFFFINPYISGCQSKKRAASIELPNKRVINRSLIESVDSENSFYVPQTFSNCISISINSRNKNPSRSRPSVKNKKIDSFQFYYPLQEKDEKILPKNSGQDTVNKDSLGQKYIVETSFIHPMQRNKRINDENQELYLSQDKKSNSSMRRRMKGLDSINYNFDFSKKTPKKMALEEYIEKINETTCPNKFSKNKNVSFDIQNSINVLDSQSLTLQSNLLPKLRKSSPTKVAQSEQLESKTLPKLVRQRTGYSQDNPRERKNSKLVIQPHNFEKQAYVSIDGRIKLNQLSSKKARQYLRESKELEIEIHKDIENSREKILQKLNLQEY